MPKKAQKQGKAKPRTFVKKAIKTKAQSNGKPTNDEALSAPMQAGLAAVAAMKPTNDAPVRETKLTKMIELLSRPEGATIEQLVDATGWQKHTVRGALSGTLHKKHGYQIVSEKPVTGHSVVANKPEYGKRVYKIAPPKQ